MKDRIDEKKLKIFIKSAYRGRSDIVKEFFFLKII
jgi:hypothetical protein